MRTAPPRPKVVLLDAHLVFTECLELALSLRGYECRPIPVPTRATASGDLLTTILRAHAGMVVMNLDLGDTVDSDSLIGPIVHSGTSVVVVTENRDRARWGQSLFHGARIVLPKDGPLSALTSTMRRIIDDLPVMARQDRDELVGTYLHENSQRRESRALLNRLSRRELEILQHLMAGKAVTDIARVSFVAEATVRTQVKSILQKLGVSSQLAAVGLAYRAEWRPVPLAG
jgi:two-component system nitrate/nitrite response regulator NarL